MRMWFLGGYILRHVIGAAVVASAILVFAVWLTQSLRLIEVIVDGAAPVSIFLQLVMLSMPNFLVVVVPVATVGAAIFAYHRLMMDSELVVIRSAGVGPLSLMAPALTLGAAVMALVFVLNLWLVPWANQEFRRLTTLVDTQFAAVFLQEGQFNTVTDEISIYFRDQSATGELSRILVHDNRNPERPVTIVAQNGLLAEVDNVPRVVLFNGRRQEVSRETGRVDDLIFQQYAIDLDLLEPELGYRWVKPDERYLPDLLSPNLDDPNDVHHLYRLKAAGHARLSQPIVVPALIALALGILLSGQTSRRGNPIRMTAAAVSVLGMIALHTTLTNMGAEVPAVFPLLYITPVIAIAVGITLPYLRRSLLPGGTGGPAPVYGTS